MPQPKNLDVYNATIKLFGSEPEPAFEDTGRLERLWGRDWGCDNDVGQIRAVLMHRPGEEIQRHRPVEADRGNQFVRRSRRRLVLAERDHPAARRSCRLSTTPWPTPCSAEGAEVVYLEGVDGGRFKSVYTRDSSFDRDQGRFAVVTRLAPRMRHGEELPVTQGAGQARHADPAHPARHGAMLEGGSFAWLNTRRPRWSGAASGSTTKASPSLPRCSRYQGVELHGGRSARLRHSHRRALPPWSMWISP